MSDNFTTNAASGGDTFAADDVGGVKHPRVKIEIGADGSASDVSSANPMPVNDASGSLTVDAPVGTPVFVRLSDGSAAITTLPVSAASLPLPSGAATSAKQDTQITAEQAIQAAVELIDDTVKAEDAGHSSGDKGIMALTVRQDTAAALGQTDADYQPLITDSSGRLHVNVGTSALPSGAATAARQDTGNTALAAIQTAVETLDNTVSGSEMQVDIVAALPAGDNNIGNVDLASAIPAGTNNIGDVDVLSVVPGTGATALGKAVDSAAGGTDTGVAALAVRDDTLSALTPIEGDYVPLRTDANGALWTRDDVLEAVVSGSEIQADIVGALPAGNNNIGDVDVASVPAPLSTTGGGTEATALRVTVASDSTGVLSVDDNGGALTVDNGGTFAVQVDGNALTALQLIDDPVFADDAAFTPGTSKVMVAGGIVDDDSTDAADEGDAVAFRATKERKQRVVAALDSASMQSGNDEVTPKFAVIDAATSGDNTLVTAVADKKIRVLALFLVAAGTVNVRFESGASGTAKTGQMNLVANTGFVLPFNPVGWFETAANTLLNLELSGAVSVDGSLTYIEVD